MRDRFYTWQDQRHAERELRLSEERKAAKRQVIVAPKETPALARSQTAPTAVFRKLHPVTPEPQVIRHLPRPAPIEREEIPPPLPRRSRATRALAADASTLASFPSTTLLHGSIARGEVNEEELRKRATLLEQKAAEFEVDGAVQQIHPGPVVTTFEFKPEPGIKYSRITGLGDDLCLALEAESVRIDRIPGKSTVGIEVPNDERATIMLRELLESPEYTQSNFRLPLALGKDITRQDSRRRSAEDAASAGGRIDRHRQERLDQRDDPVAAVPLAARSGEDDHDRSQAPRAGAVSGHPAPAGPRGHRTEDRAERAALGRHGNGDALQEAGQARRAQPGSVQRPGEAACRFPGSTRRKPTAERRPRAPALHRHRHRRTRRPDDDRRPRSGRIDHASGANGARRRHPPDSGDAAAVRGRHHRD